MRNRTAQATFISIICATRFKFFTSDARGAWQHTFCAARPRPGRPDTPLCFEQMLVCLSMRKMLSKREFAEKYRVELTVRARLATQVSLRYTGANLRYP